MNTINPIEVQEKITELIAELKNQEKKEEGSDELDNPDSSDNA